MTGCLFFRNLLITLLLLPATVSIAAAPDNGFDLSNSTVAAEDVFWGGVARDGIRSIDAPKFIAADEATFLAGDERVLGVTRNGQSKAYPIRILEQHEIVNDHFGREAIVVTYCPLCYSGMVFSAPGVDVPLTFGVSGLLYNSDVLLYDRQTESLWSQLRSVAIAGPLKGTTMHALPISHTTWREWRRRHPGTQVLSTDTGFGIRYSRRSKYRDYQRSGRLMFPVRNTDKRYRKKDIVLGIQNGSASKAYALKELRKFGEPVFFDEFAGETYKFEWSDEDDYVRVTAASGKELESVMVYWFAWYAFHPGTKVFSADD